MSLASVPSSSEKVRQFLEEEFRRGATASQMRLPPVRKIAEHLKVSTATVHYVYKELIGEGRLKTGVGRGTYLINPAAASAEPAKDSLCIAISSGVSFTDDYQQQTSRWGQSIVEAIMKAVSRQSRRITLLPFESGTGQPQEVFERLLELRDHADGLIFGFRSELVSYRERLIEAYESAGKPVISFHSQDIFYRSWNSVLTDFYTPSRILGEVLYRAGRRRMVCLCVRGLDFTVSNQPRFFGLQLGAARGGASAAGLPVYWSTQDCRIEDGYNAVREQLQSGASVPDAIFCAGDYLALGAIRALEEAGLSVPGDVSVIGSTGTDIGGSFRPGMTRMLQRFDTIADCAIAMLLRRIDSGERHAPAEYPAIDWHYGDTTTAEENELLRRCNASNADEAGQNSAL